MHIELSLNLSKVDKLDRLIDLVFSGKRINRFVFKDASHPYNQTRAKHWIFNELTFLNDTEREDLFSIWRRCVDDGRDSKLLIKSIKILKEKYAEEG